MQSPGKAGGTWILLVDEAIASDDKNMPVSPAKISFRIRSADEINPVFEKSLERLFRKSPRLYFSRQARFDLRTAFHEAVANAIEHAGELQNQELVWGHFFLNHRHIGFDVEDHGPGFDLHKVPVPNFSELKDSGRGIFMMKQLGDDLVYRRGKGRNRLLFKRFLLGQNASTREIELLYAISQAVVRGVGLDELYQLILDRALEIFKVDRASILIFDERAKRLKVAASRGLSRDMAKHISIRPGEGISGFVFQHGRALLIEDMEKNQRGLARKEGYRSRSFISVPMIRNPLQPGERPVGVINLTDRVDGKMFTRKDLTLLSTIANQAMACLAIRDLVNEVKQSESLRQKFENVRLIQKSCLPEVTPDIPGVDLHGWCEMINTVGGDYFDYQKVGDALYLVVADVSGHDLKSAMMMFNFRSQLKALLPLNMTPDKILNHIGVTLHEDLTRWSLFVSALLLEFFPATGKFRMACAGHYPPLLFDAGLMNVDSGLVLGIQEKESYPLIDGRLAKGSGFLLFTDGVVEVMNAKGQFFGIDRLVRVLGEFKNQSCADIVTGVIAEARAFRDLTSPMDDITAMALKYG